MFEYLLVALQVQNIIWAVIGVTIGALIGALPGLGPVLGIALLSPLTFGMEPASALILLGSIYLSSIWGGSITAILFNAPGTGGNAATVLDGYPLTKKGKAKIALGSSLVASCIGGIIGTIILIFMAPVLSSIGLAFGPAEYFLLAIFSLVATAAVGSEAILKGVLGAVLGLLITTIGSDIIVGYPRYTFGFRPLSDGISLIPIMIGLFAVAEVIKLAAEKGKSIEEKLELGGSWREGLLAPFKYWFITIRSSLIGAFLGALPGAGVAAANFISYLVQVRSSKNPHEYGTGKIEGVIASEASNNAVEGGSLIPTMALGIPGNSTTAVLLGTLMMHGLRPGPNLLTDSAEVVYTFFGGLILANIVMFFIGFAFMSQFSKIITIKKGLLIPLITALSFTGAYLTRQDPFDIVITLIFGFVGVLLRRYHIPLVTVIMGIILGPLIERNLYRAVQVLDSPMQIPFNSTISIVLSVLTVLVIFYPYFVRILKKVFRIA